MGHGVGIALLNSQNLLLWLILGGAVLAGLAALTARRPARRTVLPYRPIASLCTPAEMIFYRALTTVQPPGTVLFTKVRLIDLLVIPPGTPDYATHRNKVLSKHLDFVLCDAVTLRPLLALELDDASHQALARQERDAFVEAVCASADLPLRRVPVQRQGYAQADLIAHLAAAHALSTGSPTVVPQVSRRRPRT